MVDQYEIVSWLQSRPNWQQEAADRILKTGSLSQTDIDDIIALLKTEQGQKKTNTHKFIGLGHQSDSGSILHLNSIGDVEGIDNLVPRKPLTFGQKKLTVIFGNNGSGKSSYTRILKKVCGKPHAVDLKSNVFKPKPEKMSCKFSYDLAGQKCEKDWEANSTPISDLCAVDIFDTSCGDFYLTNENEASYSPEILSLFDKLVKASEMIQNRLNDEISMLPTKLPMIPPEYSEIKSIDFYRKLNASQSDSEIDTLCSWTQKDKDALDILDERLKTDDPANKATKLRSQKIQIGLIYSDLTKAITKLTPEECKTIDGLQNTSKEKRNAATEGGQVVQESAPLEGIGSKTWRALWEAARSYSEKEAYRELTFPNTTDDAYCVLCQQKLSDSARIRLDSFEGYIKGILSKAASESEKKYTKALEDLPEIPEEKSIQTSIQAAGLDVELWQPRINDLWGEMKTLVDKLKGGTEEAELIDLGIKKENYLWIEELTDLSSNIEKQAEQFDKDSKLFDHAKATLQKKALEAKKWVSDQKDAIQEELKRLRKVGQLAGWKNGVSTTAISVKAGKLAEQIITDAYIERFNNEIKRLGAHRIQVDLQKTRASKGRALHAFTLKGLAFKGNPSKTVLSEGERRIVALAAFIADVTGSPGKNPFVFDDPISSLDQDFEEKTIDRLIELSEERQVIIFTHRLSFLGILESKAAPEVICVRHEPWGAGVPGDVPIYGKNPEKALTNLLNDRLKRAEKILDAEGSENYYPLAKSICSDFRIIVERIVELVFLSDVIQRHRRDVNTKGKIKGLLKIQESDCDMIDDLMGRYSCYEHSQTTEAPVDIPAPDELRKDIEELLGWHDEFKKRKVA